jgi:hypothetical protein
MAEDGVAAGAEPAEKATEKVESGREADDLPAVGLFRLGVGFAQGLALYGLDYQRAHAGWPATDGYLFAPLFAIALLVPIFVLQAAGRMSRRTLMLWTIALVAIIASLAWYDRFRASVHLGINDVTDQGLGSLIFGEAPIAPRFALIFFAFAGLFIAQSMITAGDADSSFVTRYRNYFDATWKFGVQLALAFAFVIAFWLLLWLGSELFKLINLDFLERLIEHAWFADPATALAAAAAIHLTDVRAGLVAGIRTVALTLLSWLLPLMALLALGFVGGLMVTGLDPLWQTKSAAGIMLVAAGVLVVLINAAYQDGEAEDSRPIVLRYAELVASVLLVPLVGLAAYALALRVQQYGWTTDRIATLACVLVASCYALGYTAAALFSLLGGQWMWALESVNIFVAFLILIILLALFTPVADPARLSVLSQVSRLQSGTAKPETFDYNYLHREGGRYGELALQALASSPQGPNRKTIQKYAKAELQNLVVAAAPPAVLTANQIAASVTVYPRGRSLPAGVLHRDWRSIPYAPGCMTTGGKCDAYFADVDGDGADEILLTTDPGTGWGGVVLKEGAGGQWNVVGTFNPPHCPGARDALHGGALRVVAGTGLRDLDVRGETVHLTPIVPLDPLKCPD